MLRADRLPRADVLLDDSPEDLVLPRCELDLHGLQADSTPRRGSSRERDRGGTVAEEPSAGRQGERLAAAVVDAALHEAEPFEPIESGAVERWSDAGEA